MGSMTDGKKRATQKQVDAIVLFYRRHKRMPTYAEICTIFGYKSKNAAAKLVHKLIADGLMVKDKTGRLLPPNTPEQVRLLGLVEAGFPAPVEEQEINTMSLDEWLVEDRDGTYLLRVKGNSMIDASIADGDYVLVLRTHNIKPGDIVVANIDGEWTLKYLRQKNGKQYLEAANPEYPDMHPSESLEVEAKVVAVIRKLHE